MTTLKQERSIHHNVVPQIKRLPGRPEIFGNAGGDVADDMVWREIWQENVYHLTNDMLIGGVVLDIGANIGAFSLLCAALNRDETIIAVEPMPDNREILLQNVAANEFTNIYVMPFAISNADRPVRLASAGGAAYVIQGTPAEDEPPTIDVETRRLAGVAPAEGDIDVLKIDCEGSEYDFLDPDDDQTWEVIARCRWIVMEFHITDHRTFGGLLGRLADTHCISTIGRPSTGGMLWAHRHDV